MTIEKAFEWLFKRFSSQNIKPCTFDIDSLNNGSAEAIYQEQAAADIGSKKVTAAILAFFLGAFGAHKFFLGYNKQGVIMLLVFIFGFILLGIPSMVIGVIAFVEFIIYLTKSNEEFEQTYVNGSKPWF